MISYRIVITGETAGDAIWQQSVIIT